MAKKVIDTQNPTFSLDENSFDTVGILKAETDKCDSFYIYQINNGRLNDGTDYVFRSSREMALLAVKWMPTMKGKLVSKMKMHFLMQPTVEYLV